MEMDGRVEEAEGEREITLRPSITEADGFLLTFTARLISGCPLKGFIQPTWNRLCVLNASLNIDRRLLRVYHIKSRPSPKAAFDSLFEMEMSLKSSTVCFALHISYVVNLFILLSCCSFILWGIGAAPKEIIFPYI